METPPFEKAAAELREVMQRHNLAGVILASDGKDVRAIWSINRDWSHVKISAEDGLTVNLDVTKEEITPTAILITGLDHGLRATSEKVDMMMSALASRWRLQAVIRSRSISIDEDGSDEP
jgi:hypothetical protein